MNYEKVPLTDDHIHIDPRNGRGVEAAKDFFRAGGTHMFLVSKPSFSFGVEPKSGGDYSAVFDETLQIARLIRETGLVVFPVLGVHPAEISRLTELYSLDRAVSIMKGGLDCAAWYVEEGLAVGLKSGRPHYEVPGDVMAASNDVLLHAFTLAAELECAVQVHAETGPCDDMIGIARSAGLLPGRIVKHYATPETPLIPSLLATHEAIPALCREGKRLTMESDFMDENSSPGAVTGPKSVPRYTRRLLTEGLITPDDVYNIHTDTPSKVYGVEISL
jgi:TatD-related deoxyribonuclease